MSHTKTRLQDAEEASGFGVEFIQIDGFEHERVGAGLKHFLFVIGDSADGNDGGFVCGIGFEPPADLDSIDAGNHDVENEEVGFDAADFNHCGDAVRRRRDFISALSFEKRLNEINDFGVIVHNQNAELSVDQRCRRRYLVFSQECQQVVVTYPSMAAGRAIRRKQVLLNPIDNGTRIHVQQTTDFVSRVNCFAVDLICHARQTSLTFLCIGCCLYYACKR